MLVREKNIAPSKYKRDEEEIFFFSSNTEDVKTTYFLLRRISMMEQYGFHCIYILRLPNLLKLHLICDGLGKMR